MEMEEENFSASCLTTDKPGNDEQMLPQKNMLCSDTNYYHILKDWGEGTSGSVLKAINMDTYEKVVLKLLNTDHAAQREMMMLDVVSALDPTKTNIVQYKEKFQVGKQTCLVFERLDMNLYELLEKQNGHPLNLGEIRPIAYQLLTAFVALKSIGVVHTDLKPDNVMLVNHKSEPFRVKLVDFGVSFMTSENVYGTKTQPLGYRSPEVTLGLPISEAIDMWGLGCILLFLYLADHPFPCNCEFLGMCGIVDMLGQPADHLLNAGLYTRQFFIKNKHWCNPGWWMRMPSEYKAGTDGEATESTSGIRFLDDLITLDPLLNGEIELQDRRAFVSLLKGLLQTDPKRRLTPELGLLHPFLSMDHLRDCMESQYVMDCLDKMQVLNLNNVERFCLNCEADEEAREEEEASTLPLSDDGSHSSDRAEDLHHPCDVTATTYVHAASSAPEDSADSYKEIDLDSLIFKEPHSAKSSILKRMRRFFRRVAEHVGVYMNCFNSD